MLICIVWNYIYINDVFLQMNSRLDRLPAPDSAGCAEALRELCSYWESQTDWVGLSVGYPTVDRVGEQAGTALTCALHGDCFGFYTAIALLRDSLSDMRRLECFSVKNLL